MNRLNRLFPLVLPALLVLTASAEENPGVAFDLAPANTDASIAYVGSEKCYECHESQKESFLATLHSKAARWTDPETEPRPDSFLHEASGHRYEISVKDGRMYHTEHLRDDSGNTVRQTSHQMVFTLGSGTNAKSYFFRDGAFYVQSPLTYYADAKSWSMSPGYEVPSHRSFRRTITTRCVFCHVGSIRQVNHNPYKFEILEAKVGCERCHGPGELHVQHQRGLADAASNPSSDVPSATVDHTTVDHTIVNPRSLSRELSEAICQQCHCQGVQNVNVAGRDEWDYRPGLRLADYRADFQLQTGDDQMRLVGHVEQMHESACYQQSETLTCITCHNPHDPPGSRDLVKHHRQACYTCHDDDRCGKPHAERLQANGNDCASCHMPRAETNVSHFALHNHRIGIHNDPPDAKPSTAKQLQPILDINQHSTLEQQRLEGIAKFELHRRFGGLAAFSDFDRQATEMLLRVRQAGVKDLDMDAALAWMARSQGQPAIAASLCEGILAQEKRETMARIIATNVLARIRFDRQEFPAALSLYRQLATLHRDGSDFYFLGLAEHNNRNFAEGIAALERSIEIEPTQLGAHSVLQVIYHSTGKLEQAKFHEGIVRENKEIKARQDKVIYEKPQP